MEKLRRFCKTYKMALCAVPVILAVLMGVWWIEGQQSDPPIRPFRRRVWRGIRRETGFPLQKPWILRKTEFRLRETRTRARETEG